MKKNFSDYLVAFIVIACSAVLLAALTMALSGWHSGGHGKVQEIDFAELVAGSLHEGANVFILASVERNEEFGARLRVGQLGHAAAIPLAFVVRPVGQMAEAADRPLGHHLLRDGPGDGVVVRHAQDQSFFSVEQAHACFS